MPHTWKWILFRFRKLTLKKEKMTVLRKFIDFEKAIEKLFDYKWCHQRKLQQKNVIQDLRAKTNNPARKWMTLEKKFQQIDLLDQLVKSCKLIRLSYSSAAYFAVFCYKTKKIIFCFSIFGNQKMFCNKNLDTIFP